MTAVLFVFAAAAGAVGRHLIARLLCSWQALLAANTVGAALLGWIVSSDVADPTVTVVGVGLCGGLTTYSSFALETRRLGGGWGSVYVVITLICVCGAASLGSTL